MPCGFRRSVELDASIERVFAFHGDPHNIKDISPGWQQVQVKEGRALPRAGDEFEIVVKIFGLLPLKWRGVWRAAEPSSLLVDEAIVSPFAYWRHEHKFEALSADRTLMTDHVRYLFPGGWLGKCVGETFGRLQFYVMFKDRHVRTQRWIRENPGL